MKLLRGMALMVFLVCWCALQACGRKLDPQPACSFIQNSELRRVSWKSRGQVRLFVHSSVPREAYGAIERAVKTWNDKIRPFRTADLLVIEAWGASGSTAAQNDGYNMIYWMNEWDHNRRAEQARTTVYWGGTQIVEADLRINAKNYSFYMESGKPVGLDLESLIVHELGHVIGRSHAPEGVMQVSLAEGQQRRTLSAEDVSALKCEYGG